MQGMFEEIVSSEISTDDTMLTFLVGDSLIRKASFWRNLCQLCSGFQMNEFDCWQSASSRFISTQQMLSSVDKLSASAREVARGDFLVY